ncbi:MAG: thiamine phosphate synthase [Alphaproteobacteria bacterium]|nr:thiamine phosphate synthase [Alphaproteobacteria bacterium]
MGIDVFYPIVPDVDWLARIVPAGVQTVQLRLKDASDTQIRRQIAASIEITNETGCQLIVNDHWAQAIDIGADFIHLGQEDLEKADLKAIKKAQIRLGISSHDADELEIALAAQPDYIALGPVYETKLKKMKWAPQGLEKVTQWKSRIGDIPLVAIGGITPERAPDVLAAGADSLAVITDYITHDDPNARIREWIELTGQYRHPLS